MLSTNARKYLVRHFDLFDERDIHANGEEIHCHGVSPCSGQLQELFLGFESEIEQAAEQLFGESATCPSQVAPG